MRVQLWRILTHQAISGSPETLSELYERLSGRVKQTFSVGEYSKKLGSVSSKMVTEHYQSIISLTCTACQVEETAQGFTLSQYTGCQLLVSQFLFRDCSSVYHKTLTNDDQGRCPGIRATQGCVTYYVMGGASPRPCPLQCLCPREHVWFGRTFSLRLCGCWNKTSLSMSLSMRLGKDSVT
jgi:hypothetical protein